MDIKKEYERWLANATADADVVAELKTLDDTKIEDAFYRDLAFGTGGLRGVIGAGTNRMNVYTVAKAFVLIDPVINHDGLRDFLSLKSAFYRLNQIAANCDNQVTSFAAELVKPHHGIGDDLALGVTYSQHLLRVEILNVIDVLSVFYPLAPDTQQTARCQVLDNFFHK